MRSSRQIQRDAKRMFRFCFVDGRLDEGRVKHIVQRVAEKKPRGYLRFLRCFERFVRLDAERHTAQIESAQPLPQDLQNTISSRIQNIYGPSVSIHFSEDALVVGGVRIKVGSDIYDGTVQHSLALIAKKF